MEHIKFKIVKDYPTIDGMLYKNEIVKLDKGDTKKHFTTDTKIRGKDSTGKIWFIEENN